MASGTGHLLISCLAVGGFVGETVGWRWIEGGECNFVPTPDA